MAQGLLRSGLVLGSVVVVVALAAGCGGSSDSDSEETGGGGASDGAEDGTTGTSSTDGSASDGDGATTDGASSGGSDGSSAQGGGATQGNGGSSTSTGGQASDAGATSSGTGGGASEAATSTLGEACSPRGALACAGSFQKLTLVCGENDTWEAFETCSGDQICDTQPGPNAGTCRDPDPDCLGQEPGALFCRDGDVYACGPDTITTHLQEDCEVTCQDGVCSGADPCPQDEGDGTTWINCSTDCTGGAGCALRPTPCPAREVTGQMWNQYNTVRTPAAADACECTSGRRYFPIRDNTIASDLRLTVGAPWWVMEGTAETDACDAPEGAQCVSVGDSGSERYLIIATDDVSALSRNVSVEVFDNPQSAACP